MKLYSDKDFEEAKWNDKLPFKCEYCGKTFYLKKSCAKVVFKIINEKKYERNKFCSKKCNGKNKETIKIVKCKHCGNEFKKVPSQIKRSINNFCCQSCAATYNNMHKTKGTRRSKLEKYIEEQLIILYPNLEIHFNKKDAINSELDVYIPSLKLAFELNGIYHYEPIHGQKKFSQITNNDNRKILACAEKDIELCILDVSSFIHFKINKAKKYLDIITDIINKKQKAIQDGSLSFENKPAA